MGAHSIKCLKQAHADKGWVCRESSRNSDSCTRGKENKTNVDDCLYMPLMQVVQLPIGLAPMNFFVSVPRDSLPDGKMKLSPCTIAAIYSVRIQRVHLNCSCGFGPLSVGLLEIVCSKSWALLPKKFEAVYPLVCNADPGCSHSRPKFAGLRHIMEWLSNCR